jgi:hypothetical protein
MKKNTISSVIVLCVLTMSGCASTNMEKRADDEVKAMKVRADAENDRREKEQARLENTIKQVPSWALETPRPDGTGVYAVGMSESDKLRLALRQATLEAEYNLAKTYNQELSGSERSYTQTNGSQTSSEQYTALIDKLVSQVPVSGFEVVRQEIKPIEGKYNAFVLLKLPYEQFNRILQEQRAKQSNNDQSIKAAFDDLTIRLEKRRQQRLDEQQMKSGQSPQPVNGKSSDATAKKATDVNQNVSIKETE